jgi:hypothetical protein
MANGVYFQCLAITQLFKVIWTFGREAIFELGTNGIQSRSRHYSHEQIPDIYISSIPSQHVESVMDVTPSILASSINRLSIALDEDLLIRRSQIHEICRFYGHILNSILTLNHFSQLVSPIDCHVNMDV